MPILTAITATGFWGHDAARAHKREQAARNKAEALPGLNSKTAWTTIEFLDCLKDGLQPYVGDVYANLMRELQKFNPSMAGEWVGQIILDYPNQSILSATPSPEMQKAQQKFATEMAVISQLQAFFESQQKDVQKAWGSKSGEKIKTAATTILAKETQNALIACYVEDRRGDKDVLSQLKATANANRKSNVKQTNRLAGGSGVGTILKLTGIALLVATALFVVTSLAFLVPPVGYTVAAGCLTTAFVSSSVGSVLGTGSFLAGGLVDTVLSVRKKAVLTDLAKQTLDRVNKNTYQIEPSSDMTAGEDCDQTIDSSPVAKP